MHILVIGAAGMVGRKLVDRLCAEGKVGDRTITAMTLFDIVEPERPAANWAITSRAGDMADQAQIESLVSHKPEIIFHLAAVVSGEAEQDFEKGYRTNLDGTRYLFEAIRERAYSPRVVFTSSVAVFGAPFPDVIGDDFLTAPLTSYGVQKTCCELLLMDYSRKGFFDGIALRFPTIVVRPGKPNLAASGFFSNILREPLAGEEAVLPVSRDQRHFMASPRSAVGFLWHAATMDTEQLGARRALTMPGISVTVGEMIDALERVAGPGRVALIREEPNELIRTIVEGWPQNFDARRALSLGFEADRSIDALIEAHIEDELGGSI